MKNKKLIVVLGMHRGGTSVTTRSLSVFNIDLGNTLIRADKNINVKGYWEDRDINMLNNEMLKAINSNWHELIPITHLDIIKLHKKGYLDRAVKLLIKKVGDNHIWGFKDPRVSKLLLFWNQVFLACKFNVYYILSIRNPMSVAESLNKRDKFDREMSYLLWLEYIITALINSNETKRIIVNFDHLINQPEKELTRMSKILKLDIDFHELEQFTLNFIDKNLRHNNYTTNELYFKNSNTLLLDVYKHLIYSHKLNNNKVQYWSLQQQKLVKQYILENPHYTKIKSRDEIIFS